jgi:hypothetical protein
MKDQPQTWRWENHAQYYTDAAQSSCPDVRHLIATPLHCRTKQQEEEVSVHCLAASAQPVTLIWSEVPRASPDCTPYHARYMCYCPAVLVTRSIVRRRRDGSCAPVGTFLEELES